MKKISLVEHLRYKNTISVITKKIENKVGHYSENINELINLIIDKSYYYNGISNINILADKIVELIEYSNNRADSSLSIEIEIINEYIDSILELLKKIQEEIEKNTRIYIFFDGEDKYNILLREYLNPNVYVVKNDEYKLESMNGINCFYIHIKKDDSENILNFEFDEVILYEDLMRKIIKRYKNDYHMNSNFYHYNYLKNSLKDSNNKNTKAIAVGNSYASTGIDESLFDEKMVKLSLPSQDLYYSFKIAKKAIESNKNIKKCVIGIGYYLLNHDLSSCNSDYCQNIIRNAYYPILNDMHNSKNIGIAQFHKNLELEFDKELLFNIFKINYFQKHLDEIIHKENKSYFNNNFKRIRLSTPYGCEIKNLKEHEKWEVGKYRANMHNKMIRHKNTRIENQDILEKFVKFLNENQVEAFIVVFPMTKYYSEFLEREYEYNFYVLIDKLKTNYKFRVIDFNKVMNFTDEDFMDTDHLSEIGCERITNYLKSII